MSSTIDGKGGGHHHHQRQASLPTAPLGIETEDDPSVGVGTIIPSGLVGSPDTLSMRKSMALRGGNLPLSTSVGRPAVNFGSISVGGPSLKAGSLAVVGDSLAAIKLSLSKPAFKRVQSVVGIESFNNIQPAPDAAVVAAEFGSGLTAGGGAGGEFGHMMDDRARSQLAQNVWWRSYALQHRRNKSSMDGAVSIGGSAGGIYAGQGSETGEISTAQDALSVEGIDRDHKKQWEEYYQIFLDRYATQGDDLLARLSGSSGITPTKGRHRVRSTSGSSGGEAGDANAFVGGANERSMSMDSTDCLEGMRVFTGGDSSSSRPAGAGQGKESFGNLDESVHGGNLFAAFMRSGDGASNVLTTPTGSTENFANYAFPWEMPGAPTSSSAKDGASPRVAGDEKGDVERTTSDPVCIPRPQLRTIDSGEEMNAGPSLPALLEAHTSSTTSQGNIETILKKAFTGFHNSSKFGQDNASAYLGDDLSVRGNGLFGSQGIFGSTTYNSSNSHAHNQGLRMAKTSSTNAALTRNRSDAALHKYVEPPLQQSAGTRKPVLLWVQDCGAWKRDEQYWLLPAIIATCKTELSAEVGPSLLGQALSAYGDQDAISPVDATYSRDPELDNPPSSSQQQVETPVKRLPHPYDPFQTYLLGEVLVSSSSLIGAASHQDDDHYHIFRQLPQRWEVRVLVIKQNFLFEYLPGEPKAPVGYVHLEKSTASPRLDNNSIVHLETVSEASCLSVTTVACKRSKSSPKHTSLIRARSPAQAARWVALFEAAAVIQTEDLFDYLPLKGPQGQELSGTALTKASELGRGRFAVVRRAKRRRYSSVEPSSLPGVGGGSGAAASCRDLPLGRASAANVFSNSNNNSGSYSNDEAVCALKIVNKAAFWTRVAEGKERHDTLVREVVAQAVLTAQGQTTRPGGCPIVRLFSAFETADSLVLELELMSRNDLFDELSTSGVLKEHKTAAIVYEVVRAVAFCSEHNIAHRDVKLSNIIFPLPSSSASTSTSSSLPASDSSVVPSSLNVKLADFGMAGFFGKDVTLRGRCGTPGYVAPEILCAGVNEGYGINVDIFSVGVVAYTLLCGYEPFYGVTDKQLIAANKLAEYEFHEPEWTRISAEAKDLVSKMLVRDPRKRITPAQALDHPWIKCFSEAAAASSSSSTSIPSPPSAASLSTAGITSREEEKHGFPPTSSSIISNSGSTTPPLPGGMVSDPLAHHRRSPSDAASRAADKTARLGCQLRSQYGSPICSIM